VETIGLSDQDFVLNVVKKSEDAGAIIMELIKIDVCVQNVMMKNRGGMTNEDRFRLAG
jgi:hypothetical protein